MAETWRVVLRDGSVREVVVYRDDSDSPYSVSTHRWCAGGMRSRTAHGAVVSAMSLGDEPVREILAPGEPTRAELAAALATVTAERDVLRAQLAPLLAVHDALVAAAALPGAGASPEAMVAAVRAQGAREMLAAVDDLLDTALRHHSGRERDVKLPIEERGAAWERAAAVEALMGDVRALPLPGAEVSR